MEFVMCFWVINTYRLPGFHMYSLCLFTCTDPDPVRIRIRIYDSHYDLFNCFHISTQCPDPYVMLCFHLYVYMYVCVSISYQDRLEDMKWFHSCVCMWIIRLDHYQELFRWTTHTYTYKRKYRLGYSKYVSLFIR